MGGRHQKYRFIWQRPDHEPVIHEERFTSEAAARRAFHQWCGEQGVNQNADECARLWVRDRNGFESPVTGFGDVLYSYRR